MIQDSDLWKDMNTKHAFLLRTHKEGGATE